jgi:HEAT repeat protein
MPDTYRSIRALLSSKNPSEIQKGLRLIAIEITKIGSTEARPLFEMVTSLFYVDTLDHPELVPAVDEAINLAASFGAWVIPILIDDLDAGDIKAQWAIANVLGRIGAVAIDPMLKAYQSAGDPTLRAFILYALGKIRSPQIAKAAPTACEAAQSRELELRDTATRALGKFVESIPPATLPGEMKQQLMKCLQDNLSDNNASVRAKAIRSLGKLAKHGHLTELERGQLQSACSAILGTDEKGEWDRAFIVRKEAEEARGYLQDFPLLRRK